jgi:transcriptional regulator with XRE-family HTH domain
LSDQTTKKARQRKIERLIAQWDASVQTTVQASRKDKGLNQEVASERMGWTADILSNIESGRRAITVSEFIVLAKQIGVEPEVMFRRVLKW